MVGPQSQSLVSNIFLLDSSLVSVQGTGTDVQMNTLGLFSRMYFSILHKYLMLDPLLLRMTSCVWLGIYFLHEAKPLSWEWVVQIMAYNLHHVRCRWVFGATMRVITTNERYFLWMCGIIKSLKVQVRHKFCHFTLGWDSQRILQGLQDAEAKVDAPTSMSAWWSCG